MNEHPDSPVEILLVEDNPGDAILIQAVLREAYSTEFSVTWVEQLGEARDCINNQNFDLVLLDLSLPDSHGLDTLTRVHEEMPNLAIVVLTGTDDERVGMQALKAGAQDYLVKGSMDGIFIGRILRYAVERQRIVTRLKEFDRLKSEFLATASHEMRTPLTVIREYVSLVMDEVCGPVNDEQRQCLALVQRHCDRMTDLLNDLLDLKKIESGFIRVRRTKTDTLSLLKQCYTDFLPACQSRSQRLLLELPSELPSILADAEQIYQVLVNLLGNAHKFTPTGGTITVRAEVHSTHVHIEVRDTGRGIRAEDLNLIFEAFRQSEREDGPGMRGTGLGLTISKGIVELHDGEIGVESVYGGGSTFHFTLPIWEDRAELLAYITDRLREAQAREAPCSLLLLRVARNEVGGTLESVMQTMNRTLRASDSGLLSRVHGWIAYVLETNAQGITVALERLAGESLTDGAAPEYAVRRLTTAVDAAEWISSGPERWSALRDLSDESPLVVNTPGLT